MAQGVTKLQFNIQCTQGTYKTEHRNNCNKRFQFTLILQSTNQPNIPANSASITNKVDTSLEIPNIQHFGFQSAQ